MGKPRIPHDLHVASKHLDHLKALLAYEDRPRVTRNDASGPAIGAGVEWPAVGSTTRTPPGVSGAAISIQVLLPTPTDLTRLRSQFKESVVPARMGHMEIIGLRGSRRQTCDLGSDMQLGRESFITRSLCAQTPSAVAGCQASGPPLGGTRVGWQSSGSAQDASSGAIGN